MSLFGKVRLGFSWLLIFIGRFVPSVESTEHLSEVVKDRRIHRKQPTRESGKNKSNSRVMERMGWQNSSLWLSLCRHEMEQRGLIISLFTTEVLR